MDTFRCASSLYHNTQSSKLQDVDALATVPLVLQKSTSEIII
jgi:hypothetical protein